MGQGKSKSGSKKKTGVLGKPERIYLVDASSYAFRAYHATKMQGLSTSKGLPTGATMVFTRMLLKLIREENPTHLAVVWDAKGKTFRHELFEEYKANREKTPEELVQQVDYMRKIAEAFNFPQIEKDGYEADDVIGTIAKKAEAEGIEVVIVSGDKDLSQLVSDKVVVLDTLKDKRIDLAAVKERFQVPPEKVIDVLALWGDSSDNIPGVPKVGEKTAKALIAQYGSLEEALANADKIKGKIGENLKQFADQAKLSKKLVTIVTDVPLDFSWDQFRLKEPDRKKLTELFKELEFTRLLHEFGEEKQAISYENYRTVTGPEELKTLAAEIKKQGFISIDTETTSTDPMRAELVGISMALQPGLAVYIPLGHTGPGSEKQPDRQEVIALLKPLIENPEIKKIGQNLKYDHTVLARAGVELNGIHFDTMVASYLINPKRRTHNLEELASEFLSHKMISYEDLCGKGKKQILFSEVPLDQAARYSCEDADVALRLQEKLKPLLEEMELVPLFHEVEMPLVPVLARMEAAGVKVDTQKLKALSRDFGTQIQALKKKIFKLAGEEFNIDSPRQLSEILFKKLGLEKQKKTKTGYSTNMEVLQKLAEEHELPRLVLDYRSLAKLKSTYTDALMKMVNPETGRLHTSYNQTITSTGRLSSSDPNLQNIPVRTEEGRKIREAFVGEGDNLILSADYSQIELRLMAHFAEEPALLKAFKRGEDIHARTASEVFGVPPEKVTPEQRRNAKVINFGILYGMSAHGLTKQLGVDHKEAQAYLEAYFKRYPRVELYIKSIVAEAVEKGYVRTLMGRRIPVPEIYSTNHLVRNAAEREAINAPLQGSAADIIKAAMIKIDRALQKKKMRSRMIMQVHDELIFEVPPEELEELCKLVRKEMEGVCKLKVELKVDLSWGKSWAEAH